MNNNKKNKSRFSKKFILTIAILYSLLIVVNSISWFLINKSNNETMKSYLFQISQVTAFKQSAQSIEGLNSANIKTTKELINHILSSFTLGKEYLNIIVYDKTADENFFKVSAITSNSTIPLELKTNDIVKEKGEINYLKEATFKGVLDPRIHHFNGFSWFNVYHPYYFNKTNKKSVAIIQFMISAQDAYYAYINYQKTSSQLRIIHIIITLFMIISVIILTAIFIYNFSLLITNLAIHMRKAAAGDHSLNLNETNDADLNQLALSFNKLIEELKETKETGSHSELFNLGVELLKDNNFEKAIAVFTTLSMLRPDSFANYFNLGVAYAKQKYFEKSMIMFEKAIEINNDHEIAKKYFEKVRRIVSAKMKTILNKNENQE